MGRDGSYTEGEGGIRDGKGGFHLECNGFGSLGRKATILNIPLVVSSEGEKGKGCYKDENKDGGGKYGKLGRECWGSKV